MREIGGKSGQENPKCDSVVKENVGLNLGFQMGVEKNTHRPLDTKNAPPLLITLP